MLFRVFSLRIANTLVKLGYDIIDTEINLSNSKYKVFLFKKTEKFMEDFNNISNK